MIFKNVQERFGVLLKNVVDFAKKLLLKIDSHNGNSYVLSVVNRARFHKSFSIFFCSLTYLIKKSTLNLLTIVLFTPNGHSTLCNYSSL